MGIDSRGQAESASSFTFTLKQNNLHHDKASRQTSLSPCTSLAREWYEYITCEYIPRARLTRVIVFASICRHVSLVVMSARLPFAMCQNNKIYPKKKPKYERKKTCGICRRHGSVLLGLVICRHRSIMLNLDPRVPISTRESKCALSCRGATLPLRSQDTSIACCCCRK